MPGKQNRPSAEEIVLYEKDPETKIATITFDRAEELNAITVDARAPLRRPRPRADIDDDVKVLVIRANGPNLEVVPICPSSSTSWADAANCP